MTSDQERAAPAQQPVAWRCDECGCASYARMDERKPEGGFGPSPLVRCVNCKKVHNVPAASEPELRAEIVRLTRERDEARRMSNAHREHAQTAVEKCASLNRLLSTAESRVEALSAEVGTARAAAFEEAAQIAEKFKRKKIGVKSETWHPCGRWDRTHHYEEGHERDLIASAIRSRAALDKGA